MFRTCVAALNGPAAWAGGRRGAAGRLFCPRGHERGRVGGRAHRGRAWRGRGRGDSCNLVSRQSYLVLIKKTTHAQAHAAKHVSKSKSGSFRQKITWSSLSCIRVKRSCAAKTLDQIEREASGHDLSPGLALRHVTYCTVVCARWKWPSLRADEHGSESKAEHRITPQSFALDSYTVLYI